MGGNNSKVGSGGEVLSARIRNRLEELRKRHSSGGEESSTLSTKNCDGSSVDEGKSQSSEEIDQSVHNMDSPNHSSRVVVEKLSSKVVQLPGVELKTEKVQSAELQTEIKYGRDDDDQDEDKDDDDDERLIGPSSPSFKVYCDETDNQKEEQLRDSKALGDENQMVGVLQKSPCANSIDESSASASGNTNEIIEMKSASSKRKGNKKKKFGAMKKNLRQVKNLNMNRMNPMFTCTGIDRKGVLSDD